MSTGFQGAAIAAVIAMSALGATTLLRAQATDEITAIERWELDEVAAERIADISFFEKHLVEDWTGGMSSGAFRSKEELIAALRHPASGFMPRDSISHLVAREYGDDAVATFTASYDVLVGGKRVTRQIITTDTFVKDDEGEWMQVASHSSPARTSP
jgi:hypothetical protein